MVHGDLRLLMLASALVTRKTFNIKYTGNIMKIETDVNIRLYQQLQTVTNKHIDKMIFPNLTLLYSTDFSGFHNF